jgi:FAD/FMN-containing dehydrogenase
MSNTDVHTSDSARPGALRIPGSAGSSSAAPWNLSVPSRPRAVAPVQDGGEVAAAIRDAATAGLRVGVRSTGHGATPLDGDVLLLDTASMTDCTVHPAARWARVGAGVRWQQLIEQAAPYGLAPICGSAPGVGVVGLLTGGGIGPLVRTYGACSDYVRAIDIVTGTGEQLRATPTQHPDLFWGLRGGKSTLGIVTAMEIDLVPLETFYGGAVWFAADDTQAVLHAWRRLCQLLPEQATTSAAIMRLPVAPDIPAPIAGRQSLAIRFGWVGDPDRGSAYLDDLRHAADPILDDVHVRDYREIGAVHGDPVTPMPVHDRSALLSGLPPEAVDRLLETVSESDNVQAIVEIRQLGGAVAREPLHPSAVCHRDAAFQLFISGVQIPGVDTDTHADLVLAAMSSWSTGGLLPNFATSDEPDLIARCYDRDTLHWLTALADQYDPAGTLHAGQVVRN